MLEETSDLLLSLNPLRPPAHSEPLSSACLLVRVESREEAARLRFGRLGQRRDRHGGGQHHQRSVAGKAQKPHGERSLGPTA
jgi:hypothetical protein